MDWGLWCLAGERLGDMGDQHLSEDGLGDSRIQGLKANLEAG